MTASVTSKHGVAIRLTDERWAHVTEEHCELAGLRAEVLETVAEPTRVLAGVALMPARCTAFCRSISACASAAP